MNIETNAVKQEVTFTLKLTLTEDEAVRLSAVFGGVGGCGPTRDLTTKIWLAIGEMLTPYTNRHRVEYHKYIEESMVLTGN